MVSFLLFVVSIFIFSGYFMLYWFVRKDTVSIWGALVMVSISIPCYLLFPYMFKTLNMEIQSVTMVLFLFVLAGIGVVSIIEHKINENVKSKFKLESQVNNEEKQILSALDNEQTLSYVDFEHKSQKSGDVFSKYIRGEISLNQVVEKIRENAQKKEIILIEENDRVITTFHSFNKTLDLITAVVEENAEQSNDNNANNEQNKLTAELEEYEEVSADNANIENAKNELKLEDCIDKAFELKTGGMLLEAVEYYIEALDKKPEEQLILWIVIEICSIYKQLGNEQLAKETMNSYIEAFGDNLNPQLRDQIVKNL